MQSAGKLKGEGVPEESLFVGDVVKGTDALKRSLAGADALVIATSAVPQIKPLSLLKVHQLTCFAALSLQPCTLYCDEMQNLLTFGWLTATLLWTLLDHDVGHRNWH